MKPNQTKTNPNQTKIEGLKKFLVQNDFFLKKNLVKKNFWSKKVLVKKFYSKTVIAFTAIGINETTWGFC